MNLSDNSRRPYRRHPSERLTVRGFMSRNEWVTHLIERVPYRAAGATRKAGAFVRCAARGATHHPVRTGHLPAPPSGRTWTMPRVACRQRCRYITTPSGRHGAACAIVTIPTTPADAIQGTIAGGNDAGKRRTGFIPSRMRTRDTISVLASMHGRVRDRRRRSEHSDKCRTPDSVDISKADSFTQRRNAIPFGDPNGGSTLWVNCARHHRRRSVYATS